MKTVLTIAGSDPTGGAGVQSDLMTFSALRVRGLSAVTAVTAQDSTSVRSVMPVPPRLLADQIGLLLGEFRVDAAKTGMLGSVENLRALKRLLKAGKIPNLVMDTPIRSTSGAPLIDGDGARELRTILRYARVVTPNLSEASSLTGVRTAGLAGMERAARAIFDMGAGCVLVKGGHLSKEPIDVLFDGRSFTYYEGKRIKGRREAFHGTGCVLSAAIAAWLARGRTPKVAVKEAKAFLEKTLRARLRA